MKNYKDFLKDDTDLLVFPLKKIGTIIKDKIDNNLKIGENSYHFNFLNEKTLPISFNLIINYNNENILNYGAFINMDDVITTNFKDFDLKVNIIDININYNKIYSLIIHELKHVYDIYYDNNVDSMRNVTNLNYFKRKYKNNKYLIDFIEHYYLAFEHEIDARTLMVYDKLRWLKTFDTDELVKEFEKTYVYKSIKMLQNYNSDYLINNVNHYSLIDFTNEFKKLFLGDYTKNDDVNEFYKKQQIIFKNIGDKCLENCLKIIDELVKDKKPYMENKLFIMEDYINKEYNFKNVLLDMQKII